MLKGNLCRCTGYRAIHDALAGVANVVGSSLPDQPDAPSAADPTSSPATPDAPAPDPGPVLHNGPHGHAHGAGTALLERTLPTTTGIRSVGRSQKSPAGSRIVSGKEPYTLDIAIAGLLHLVVLRSPPLSRPNSLDRHRCRRSAARRRVRLHTRRRAEDALLERPPREPHRRPR